MKKLSMIVAATGLSAVLAAVSGCTSPLKSDDPAVRARAVAELSDDKELFFVAMNIGVYVEPNKAILYEEHYLDDVRVAAMNRLQGVELILKCAAWTDGCIYADPGIEHNRFEYKGEIYYRCGDDCYYGARKKVHPGDAVRAAAKKRLAQPSEFARLCRFFDQFNEGGRREGGNASSPRRRAYSGVGETPSLREVVFPDDHLAKKYNYDEEDDFFDCRASIKKANPLNSALREIVAAQNDQRGIREFLALTRDTGARYFPDAVAAAVDRLDASDQASLVALFKRLFPVKKQKYDMPKDFALKVYARIDDPDAETVSVALRYSDSEDFMKILSKVKRQNAFETVFCDGELPQRVKDDDQQELYCPYDVRRHDVKLDALRPLMAPVTDDGVLSKIALASPLFNARLAAVEKMTSDRWLAPVASDPLKDCPYDTSAPNYRPFCEDRMEWSEKQERQSAMKIRRLAISRLKDIETLRKLRLEDKDAVIKKAVSKRLVALGHSDAGEIIAAVEYDRNLFSMLDEISGEGDLENIAANAKLRGVRLIAASRLKGAAAQEIAKNEVRQIHSDCPEGRINIGGFYLGLNIEDAYALILARYGDVKPTLYLDGKALCIAGGDGRDLAWARADSRKIHWLTLSPQIIRKIVGFKTGTFDDLQHAVASKLGVEFKYGTMSKGEVSQRVAEYETVDGETLRYFAGKLEKGEDFLRTVRKAVNQQTIDFASQQEGVGAALANVVEDALQGDENAKNARSPRFAPQGSIQLQFTRNAVKGN